MHRALYAAFDAVPSRKGAGVHIERFAGALFERYGGGALYALAPPGAPLRQRDGPVEAVRFQAREKGLIARAGAFARRLGRLVDELEPSLELCHFRDPWSAAPILFRDRAYAAVYEVNGLPSVELPARLAGVPASAVRRIRRLEDRCLAAADRIVVPSPVTADYLVTRGVASAKLDVIPNGADPPPPAARPPRAPARYAIYVGALQPWQGMHTLLRAFARLDGVDLVIATPRRDRAVRRYERMAARLGLTPLWLHGLDAGELAPWLQHADLSVAPLSDCERNSRQGCAPLKILESMAAGVPLVASELASVRAIVEDDAVLVPPDRPAELARAIRAVLADPAGAAELAERGSRRVARDLSWSQAASRLELVYGSLA